MMNLCCSKRQKNNDNSDQPLQQQEVQKQELQRQNSDEFRQRNQEALEKRQKEQLKVPGVITSLEMEVEQPIEGYLQLSDKQSDNKMGSWEQLNISKNSDQFGAFGAMAHSQVTNLHSSNGSNGRSMNYQGTLATSLKPIQEFPHQQLARSISQTNLDKVKRKKIKKDKPIKEDSIKKQAAVNAKVWTPQEDLLLRAAYSTYNGNWREIAQQIPGRNMNQCAQRWRRLNPAPSKSKWDYKDDEKIIQLVKEIGKNWVDIAKRFPGKTGKQIRERYLNKLDPSISKEPWTKAEDEIILQVYKEHGPKWSIASKQMKGRPVIYMSKFFFQQENMVKNRFYSYIRRVVLGQQNPYQIVFNTNDIEADSNSLKQFSVDQTLTQSSQFSSQYFNDDDYMEEEDNFDGDQFKL